MAVRTTSEAVEEVLKNDFKTGHTLTASIAFASNLVTKVCTSTSYDATDLEYIERYLAAWAYCQSPRPHDSERAGPVSRKMTGKTDLGFDNNHYGQTAMRAAYMGELGKLNEDIKEGRAARTIGSDWLGSTDSDSWFGEDFWND
jgi:hypothetical protein